MEPVRSSRSFNSWNGPPTTALAHAELSLASVYVWKKTSTRAPACSSGAKMFSRIRPIQARPPRSRGAAACDAAASAASCSGLDLCGFLRDGVDSAGFCDLYYGLKEDYSGGDAAGERWRSEHAK